MKGRKPNPAPVVVPGPWTGASKNAESPKIDGPDWLLEFDGSADEWGKRRAEIAKVRFAVLIKSMTERGTLDTDNNALVEMAAGAYADWKLAEAHVTKFGPIVPAPKTNVPMHNPFKALADAAFKRLVIAEDRLGIPPVERGRATKAGGKVKKKNAAEAYIGKVPAWAPSAKK
jgi:phage terminase small subunit